MTSPQRKKGVHVNLHAAQVEAIDEVAEEFSLSRSEIVRDLLGKPLGDDPTASQVVNFIDDTTLRLAEKEAAEERLLARQKLREKRASFVDRVRGYFRNRLEGDAPYEMADIEALALGYREDAQIWHDDADEIERKQALVDDYLDWYEAGLFARRHAESVDTEVNTDDVSGWFEVGEHLHTLREHRQEVEERVRQVADRQGVGLDADAVIDAVASEWSVCRGAVHLLIESMTITGASIQDALTIGGDTLRTPAPSQAITSADDIPDDATVRLPSESGDGPAEVAHAGDSLDDDPGADDVVEVAHAGAEWGDDDD